METPLAQAATINMEGPSPFIAVVLGGQDFLDPATVTTDTYSYALTDNRSGGGFRYTYDALERTASFAINGLVGKFVPQTNF